MGENLSALIDEIAISREVEKEAIFEAIELGISLAARRETKLENLVAHFNKEDKTFSLNRLMRVQEIVNEPELEITVEEAKEKYEEAESGDEVEIPYGYQKLNRLASRTVRSIMRKSMGEIASEKLRIEMELVTWKMVTAEIKGKNYHGDILCSVGERYALLPEKEQLFRESLKEGDFVQAVIIGVKTDKNKNLYVLSRTHPLLLGGLLIREVPEISDGHIVIKGIARDTAGQSKVAVMSKVEKIDPKGACIGPSGARIQRIMKELAGEKIDILNWFEKPEDYIVAALTPAKIKSVSCDEKKKTARVEPEEDQLSIAVGKGGLNVRLAGRLTRWNLDIRPPRTGVPVSDR